MRPEPEMIPVLIDAAEALTGSPKRLFMAKTVQAMGRGGPRWAEVHLGWCRDTLRKGTHELRTGLTCVDAFPCRRRKPAEEHWPRLLEDIRSIADGQSQADPKFQTKRLFTRISAAEVRRQLIATKGDTDAELPVLVQRELEFLPVGVSEGSEPPVPDFAASCREGLTLGCQSRSLPGRERARDQTFPTGPGSGLGPWGDARGAPQQSPILRPGYPRLSSHHDAHATSRDARRRRRRVSRASSSLRSRSAKIVASRPASLSIGVT